MTTNIYTQTPSTFVSEKLRFEKITKEHKSHLSEIFCNPQVQEAYNTGTKEDFENVDAQLSIIEEQWQKYEYGLYILFDAENNFIGIAGYHTVIINEEGVVDCFNKNKANDLELYIILMPQYWRKGYGFEIACKLVEIAFKHLPFTSIIVYIESKNDAALALAKKFDIKKEKEVVYNNKPHILYRLIKKENHEPPIN